MIPMNNEIKKTKKLNNKGFSLVELIIVIAIMAVLIGVLAPQYLRYVERSRRSADLDNWDAIISAIEVYASDPVHTAAVTGSGTVDFSAKGVNGTVTTPSWVEDALTDAGINVTTISMKSNIFGDSTVVATADASGVTFTITGGNATDSLQTALGR